MSKQWSKTIPKFARLSLFLALTASSWSLLAQDPAKALPMEGATTDPAAHAKIGLKPPANPSLPSLFLVGDSTVRNGRADGAGGQWGWGEPLVDLFDTNKINVVNRAIGGRSSRSYIMENQWQETLAFVKRGDVILFQWGHNDDGPLDDPGTRAGHPARHWRRNPGDRKPDPEGSRNRPHLRLVPEEVCRRYIGQGRYPDHLLTHSAQDLEGWKDCAERLNLWGLGAAGG